MTKKGPLGKAEKFYVEGHYKTTDAKEIAKELDRPITAVKKHIDKVKTEEPKLHTAGGQMARQDGIVTMTQSASELSDEVYKSVSRRLKEEILHYRNKEGC